MKILLATNNKHKIEEIQNLASQMLSQAIQFLTPAELNIHCQPEENGTTFIENSTIKAIAFYNEMCKLNIKPVKVVADDSGLEIEALNGLPGVQSARFACASCENQMPANENIDKANREKVLSLMLNKTNRQAKFSTALTLYDGTQANHYIGQCHGKIINEERGNNGFGYDSIFIPEGFNKTFAEMNQNEKNAISHRQIAIVKLLQDKINLSV